MSRTYNSQEENLDIVSFPNSTIKKNEIEGGISEKLNEFYKLKYEYDKKVHSHINNIIKDKMLNMKQKQDKYRKMKVNCINCGRNVGTIFEHKDGILTSICGDKIAPCNLNIKINRGKYVSLEMLLDVFQTGVDDVKEKIITTKLDLLFGYEQESNTLKIFTALKEELTQDLESLMEYKTKFIEIVSNLDNKQILSTKMTMFYNKVSLIKSTVDEFNETGQIQLIKDMITLYDTELTPLLVDLRNLKYKYMAVEYDLETDTHKLVRNVFTLQDMTIPFEIPKVISFTVGDDNTSKPMTSVLREDDDNDDMEYMDYMDNV